MFPSQSRSRWVFGDYVVYATDANSARRIYQHLLEHADPASKFGVASLDDGVCGNWVLISRRCAKPPQ